MEFRQRAPRERLDQDGPLSEERPLPKVPCRDSELESGLEGVGCGGGGGGAPYEGGSCRTKGWRSASLVGDLE